MESKGDDRYQATLDEVCTDYHIFPHFATINLTNCKYILVQIASLLVEKSGSAGGEASLTSKMW